MSNFVTCFDNLITNSWKLPRSEGRWQLRESGKNATHTLIEIQGGKSLAFSLDQSRLNAFSFMRNDTPLKGVRSVCDAIVVADTNRKPLIIMVEMKSGDESGAEQQILRSHAFMQWLVKLLSLNGHCAIEPEFCGVISFKPRKQERKGQTSRAELPKPTSNTGSFSIFRLKNHPRIHLDDIALALTKQ